MYHLGGFLFCFGLVVLFCFAVLFGGVFFCGFVLAFFGFFVVLVLVFCFVGFGFSGIFLFV